MSNSFVTLTLLVVYLTAKGECQAAAKYTAQKWGTEEKCLGDCLYYRHGEYYYCYVDEEKNWDYCSPHQDNLFLLKKAFTVAHGPCKNTCTWSQIHYSNMCDNYWGYLDKCVPEIYEYYRTYNYEGTECIGMCDKHEGTRYYWCRDPNQRLVYCSPHHGTRLDQTIDDLMKSIPRCHRDTCDSIENRVRRQVTPYCAADSRNPGSILAYVAAILALGTVNELVSVQQPNQPIYRYAYLNLTQTGGPILPLFISATIRPTSIPAQGTRDPDIPSPIITNVNRMGKNRNRADGNNDDNGHLIAYENGGPYELYNFAPQPRSLNRGIASGVSQVRQTHWRRAEDSINEWVRSGHGYVDQTVVVVYDNHRTNPRPVGFAQHVVYYHSNGAVRYECDDFYSNDPNDDPVIHDELI